MSNFKLWRNAFLNIYDIETKEKWNTLDIVSKYLTITRTPILLMTASTVILGGFLAYKNGAFNVLDFLLCLLGLVFAHACMNLIDEFIDHPQKKDQTRDFRPQYGMQVLENGYITLKQWSKYLLFSGLVALICISILILRTDIRTLYMALTAALCILLYTWPLKYIGLGEPIALFIWGPLMVCGSYFACSGGVLPILNSEVFLIAIIYALGPINVLFSSHIDKIKRDQVKQAYTLPVLFGERIARHAAIGFWVAQYLLCFILFLFGYISWSIGLILFAIPAFWHAVKVFRHPCPNAETDAHKAWVPYFSAAAFLYNKTFSGFFILALILDFILQIVMR